LYAVTGVQTCALPILLLGNAIIMLIEPPAKEAAAEQGATLPLQQAQLVDNR